MAGTGTVDLTTLNDEKLDNMSVEELDKLERQVIDSLDGEPEPIVEGNAEEASETDGEESVESETTETTDETEGEEVTDDTGKEEPASDDTGKAEEPSDKTPEWEKPNYKALQGIIEKTEREKAEALARLQDYQSREGEFQRQQQQLNRIVNDPKLAPYFVQNALGGQLPIDQQPPDAQGYDYTDPNSVARVAANASRQQFSQLLQTMQANAKRQKETDFMARINANKAKVAAEHGVTVQELEAYALELQRKVESGDVFELAYLNKKHPDMIANAKKEAIAKVQGKLKDADKNPKRASGASAGKQTLGDKVPLDKMTDEQIIAKTNKLTETNPDSPELDRYMNELIRRDKGDLKLT